MSNLLIGLVMTLLVLATVGAIVGYSLWVERLEARRPKSEEAPAREATHAPAEAPAESSLTRQIAGLIMSRVLGPAGPIDATITPLSQLSTGGLSGVAMADNAITSSLSDNVLSEEARDIVRFWAMVEAAERVIKHGKLGQAEAIEVVFGCSRSSRPESVYARARAALLARSEAAYRTNQARLVELQAAAHEE